MNQGRKTTSKCHRKSCRKPMSAHVEGGDGCWEFLTRKSYARVSGSFNADALEVGAAVLRGILQGKDVRLMVARPAFGVFAKTVTGLADRARTLPTAPSKHPVQDKVLEKLREYGTASSRQIADALGMSLQKSVSPALNLLKHKGLVTLNRKIAPPSPPLWTAKPSNVTQLSERKVAVR